jgi:transcriptional/translational regulatory protein YebC/TACO1
MKKVLIVLVLIMAVMVVNAQVTNTTDSTRLKVNLNDLPKAIKENIAKDYVGYTIKEATIGGENKNINYEVVVAKGIAIEVLVYDKELKFVKTLPWVPKK